VDNVATGWEFGGELCQALGIDAAEKRVTNIIIESPSADVVHVTIERLLADEEAQEVINLVERYNLVRVDDTG